MPNLLINGNGRNHLVEMTLPVNRWSDRYVSVEYNRQGTNPAGRGDMFRVVSSRPATRFSYRYYDKNSKEFVGSGGGVLAGAGDFIDVTSTQVPVILPYGYSVWEADKPILVTQLSTSATFDGDDQHDPFMVHVTPISHAATSTVFQTPTGTQFNRHNLNLIVQTDSSSATAEAHLRSIEIDGLPLYNHPGTVGSPLLSNHMGGGLYWATISLNTEIKSHQITSNGKASFIGYLYGYGNVDSYGWPIGYGRAGNTRSIDTMPPFLVRLPEDEDTSLYLVEFAAYEIRNLPRQPRNPPERTDQVETGISSIFIQEDLPSNLELILRTDDRFPGDKPHTAFRFAVRTIDSTEAGTGTIVVRDFAGNTAYYPITIDAPVRPSMRSVDFGMTILETRPEKTVHITNPTPFRVNVTNIRLKNGAEYELRTDRPLPLDLDSGEVVSAFITYRSERETKNYRTDWDLDTMLIFTPLMDARIPIKGVAGIPHCSIDNILYGVVTAGGRPACREVSVRNTGSFPLYIFNITGYEGTDFTFQLYPGALADPVEPFKDRALGLGCYVPPTEGHDTALIRLAVNATSGDDTTATWFGSTSGALVLDDSPGSDLSVSQGAPGQLILGFSPGSAGYITVWDLAGRLLASQRVDAGSSGAFLTTVGWSVGPVVIVLQTGTRQVSRMFVVGG